MKNPKNKKRKIIDVIVIRKHTRNVYEPYTQEERNSIRFFDVMNLIKVSKFSLDQKRVIRKALIKC